MTALLPPAPVDDRIVLPLSKVTVLARKWCAWHCRAQGPDAAHTADCLIPDLEARDRLLVETYAGRISPDCMDPFKHDACPGCLCDHHRPLGGVTSGPSSPRPRHATPQ